MAVAALTLAGCGGSGKNAKDVAAQPQASSTWSASAGASSSPTTSSYGAGPSDPTASPWGAGPSDPTPSATASVRVGAYCTVKGAVGKTVQGKSVTCTTRSGETHLRWVEVRGTGNTVTPGAYCSTEGATGTSASGKNYKCSKQGNDSHTRWHRA